MEMRCYHKILYHVTNEEARAQIQQAIGPHEDLLTIVKRRKLQWYGHVSRLSGLAKTILQGTVKGGRRQGRQKKRLEDNIREWTGLEFAKSQRAVENRENGGNCLQNHLWCPNDSRGYGIDEMRAARSSKSALCDIAFRGKTLQTLLVPLFYDSFTLTTSVTLQASTSDLPFPQRRPTG